ncbi:hypothetical protein QSV08_07805 [Maribacter sp. BPC-D8]|uniref:hypothetical protein n=1 Tax=Maribacter sp. BPC-D8 TaxID=3053613 RepID=UPI002B49C3A4|nr:hypothetical protein [Maribacter sp. BPC-D8]WRI31149.1 hypothetical protein QSV08_07805 [Maribacter sp. BPC-D8]
MKEFSTEIESMLELYLTKSSDFYEKGNTIKAGECLVKAYEFIPEPKEEYNESYNYCTYVLDYILDENYNLDKAENWLKELEKINKSQKCWSGSYEFYAGKTYFELKNYSLAKKFFDICIKIGKGNRYFEGENPKYLNFQKNPEKYI